MPSEPAPSHPTPPRRRPVSIVRGTANVVALLAAIALGIGWSFHFPVAVMANLGLLFGTAFVVSFIAILIENRTSPENGEGST